MIPSFTDIHVLKKRLTFVWEDRLPPAVLNTMSEVADLNIGNKSQAILEKSDTALGTNTTTDPEEMVTVELTTEGREQRVRCRIAE